MEPDKPTASGADGATDVNGEPKISKRAAEKAAKKAAAAAKKKEYAVRPKEDSKAAAAPTPGSVFAEGWLKRVYEEKPVSVRTRFPPEPNGFLHIGHAKAIAVNFGFAKYYNGICFLRYDDTNPAKEEDIFVQSIRDIIEWLGFTPYKITYSSDHFQELYDLAEKMIQKDKGYVCHCTREDINMQRGGPDNTGPRYACPHRNRPVEESLQEFRNMRDGKYQAGEAHLRMKQNLEDGNPQMWDLAAYRIVKDAHHHRTGDKWKIYPTYDFTHCICDAFEEISHSLCTTEFRLSRISYDWLLEVLDMKDPGKETRGPMQREYGRLNVEGTILSKRKIELLVKGDPKHDIPPAVRGWDDPRLYTLVAIRRRGVPARAVLNFVEELGVTDSITAIQPVRLETSIRKHLERTVPRLALILRPIKVTIEDFSDSDAADLSVPYDPKGTIPGERKVAFTKVLYIDADDFREEDDPNFFRLAPNKTVGLLNAPFAIKATSFSKHANGKIKEIKAVKVPSSEKPKAYIHWVSATSNIAVTAREYNALFTVSDPNELDFKEGGYAKHLNPDSEVSYEDAVVEKEGLEALMAGEARHEEHATDSIVRFQAYRTGYFCIDPERKGEIPSVSYGRITLNRIVPLREDTSKAK